MTSGVSQRVKGNVRDVQGGHQGRLGSRGSSGVPGGSRGGQGGGVKASQEVKTSVRGVPWVKGGLRDPRGLRWTSWVYQGFQGAPRRCPRGSRGTLVVSKGINKDVRGVRGSRGTPRGVRGCA